MCTGEALGAPSGRGHHAVFIDVISPQRSGVEQEEWAEISGKIWRGSQRCKGLGHSQFCWYGGRSNHTTETEGATGEMGASENATW